MVIPNRIKLPVKKAINCRHRRFNSRRSVYDLLPAAIVLSTAALSFPCSSWKHAAATAAPTAAAADLKNSQTAAQGN